MADIFISYSRPQADLTKDLADHLEAQGFTVWWDTSLVTGSRIAEAIKTEIALARAIIVIWSPESARSDWVQWEAGWAADRDILIPLRTPEMDVRDIPPPFGVRHTAIVTNRTAISGALRKLGVTASPTPRSAIEHLNGPMPLETRKPVAMPMWNRIIAAFSLRWLILLAIVAAGMLLLWRGGLICESLRYFGLLPGRLCILCTGTDYNC